MNLGVQPSRTVFGEVVYEPGGKFGPRVQRDLQLVLIHSGSAAVEVDGVPQVLQEGTVALLKPGHQEFFQFSRTGQTRHSWCAMSYPAFSASVRRALEALAPAAAGSERLRSLLLMGVGLRAEMRPSAEALKRKLGEACLWEYFHLLGNDEEPGLPRAIERVTRHLQEHFSAKIDVSGMAEVGNVAPSHLIRLFRENLGITPARYLWNLRLNEGMRMLRETGLSISEVAFRCGFQNPFHFSRLVKQETRLSPKAYRERSWRRPSPVKPEGEPSPGP
jgi:AraC family transcriptional regulator, arabinose operon regulatory protein